MTTLKKAALALVFFISMAGTAQDSGNSKPDPGKVFKFLTTGFSVSERNASGKWGKWSAITPASIVITLDTKKGRIIVYSQEVQLFDVIRYEKIEENENDIVYPFTCTDDDGMPFTISLITRKKQGNRKQLYINQKDVIVMYNIINFPDKDVPKK